MIKHFFVFIAFLIVYVGVNAQKDQYYLLKTQYDSLRKAENFDEAKKILLKNIDNKTFDLVEKINLYGQIGECYYYLNKIFQVSYVAFLVELKEFLL